MKTLKMDTIDKFGILQEVTLFDGVPVENLWTVAERAQAMEYDDTTPLIIQEHKTDASYFYVLVEGVAQLRNAEQELETMTKNAFYGEKEIITGKETYFNSIRLISPQATFLRISKRLLLSLFDNFIEMPRNVSKLLSEKLLSVNSALAKEMEKNRNIDLIMNRFNVVATELMKSVGREEVEQKFLLKENFDIKVFEAFGLKVKKLDIHQVYLKVEEDEEERARKFGNNYFHAVKRYTKDSKSRDETEKQITKEEFQEHFKKAIGSPIKKTRYQVQDNPEFKELCVDIYDGALAPLKVAEVEYWSRDDVDNLEIPVWLKKNKKKDVTNDKRYKNKNLAMKGLPKE